MDTCKDHKAVEIEIQNLKRRIEKVENMQLKTLITVATTLAGVVIQLALVIIKGV